ncbi:MAG: protein translocase subunit SecF [Acidobacteriota bacterium]
MQFLTETKIDFMKYRKVFVWVSIALLVGAFVELFVLSYGQGGLNFGIDFAGGTQMTVRINQDMEIDELRQRLIDAGLSEISIQQFGDVSANEVLLRVPVNELDESTVTDENGEPLPAEALAAVLGVPLSDLIGNDGELSDTERREAIQQAQQEGSTRDMIEGLETVFGGGEGIDLNQRGADVVTTMLADRDPDGIGGPDVDSVTVFDHYNQIAEAIIDKRTEDGILSSWDEIASATGMSPAVRQTLESNAMLGSFSVLSTENVGPQIGAELQQKGLFAMVLSLLGMLVYIWFRFELRFGVGALVAVFHDFMIVLGLYALFDYELNLSTIAAFLTLVGYSVNDTVIIFDRVRENMRKSRRMSMEEIMNLSINQTLARTFMTSGTTLLVVGTLFVYGGDVIRGFAFVLLCGVVVGTYSSIFVASPFALLWEKWFGRDAKQRRAQAKSAAAKA